VAGWEGSRESFETALEEGAAHALAQLGDEASIGESLAAVLEGMYNAAYLWLAQAAARLGHFSDAAVARLSAMKPPQTQPTVLQPLKTVTVPTNVLLIISKCAAGDHVAMDPRASHATLLRAAERAGEGKVVTIDIAERVFGCRRAGSRGSCKDIDVGSGMCEQTDPAERRAAQAFHAVWLRQAATMLPECGRITIAINHRGWKGLLEHVQGLRQADAALRRSVRPTVVRVGHYRYINGKKANKEGRTFLLLGYILAGALAGGVLDELQTRMTTNIFIDTYGLEWVASAGGKRIDTDLTTLLEAAMGILDRLGGAAGLLAADPPRALLDLTVFYLSSSDGLRGNNDDVLKPQIEALKGRYHELTDEDRSRGGGRGGEGLLCINPFIQLSTYTSINNNNFNYDNDDDDCV
jgi:hypothetical protein